MLFYFIYMVLCILALYIILYTYLRIKMPFWRTQPVFHIYNLNYWLNPPGRIDYAPPAVNAFVNLSNNQLLQIDLSNNTCISNASISNANISNAKISQFIRDYYMIHESSLYKPSEEDILAYLQCTNQPSFFNVYQETPLAFGSPEREMLGVISARVLNVTLHSKKKRVAFPVYYIDNLCVNPGYRKKGIAPEMIQTLYYRISRANPKVNAYLFKREGQLNALVPQVCYDTVAFTMTRYRHPETILTAAMQLQEIGISQLNILMAFFKEQLPKFDCIILPDVSSVLNLLKLGKIKIYGILFKGELMAVYIFRILELYYGEKKATECITILSADEKNTDLLVTGFLMSWLKLATATTCEIVLIEGTAHSNPVIKALDAHPRIDQYFKTSTAFFFYNYIAYSTPSAKTLLFY